LASKYREERKKLKKNRRDRVTALADDTM